MNGFLLDTHYWLWLQTGNSQRLKVEARHRLHDMQANALLFLSATSVWEVARLSAAGHIDLGGPIDAFVELAIRDGGLQLLPLTTKILIESTRLPGDLHRDPADRLLAATARENDFALVTRDRELRRYSRRGHLRTIAI